MESTRTSLGDDLSVIWSEGDAFTLFSNGRGEEFRLVSGAGTSDASFEGVKPVGDAFVGIYGGEVFSFDGQYVRLSMPATQTYVRGSFADAANPMIATATGDVSELFFRNVCGLMELQITGTGTLSRISLSSEGAPMSGMFDVDSNDLAMYYFDDHGESVEITGINEPLSPTEPLSVYCVLPPWEYNSLVVRMTDSEGNVVTKEAAQAVTVERAKVTPVTGLVFDTAQAEAPAVSITVNKEVSNFKFTSVTFDLTGSVEADGIMFLGVYKSVVDDYLQDPQNSLLGLMKENGILASSVPDVEIFNTNPSQELVFLAVALSGEEMVGDIVRLDYTTPAIPKDLSLNVHDEDVAITCGETRIVIEVSLPEGARRVHPIFYFGSAVEGVDDSVLYNDLLVVRDFGKDVDGDTYTVGCSGLTPGTEYVFAFVVEGENGFSELYRTEITTLEHVASAATIEISTKAIFDVTAEFNIALSDAASYKLFVIKEDRIDHSLFDDENALAAYIDAAGQVFSADETSVSLPVIPSTSYYVLGLAYDAAGVYDRPTYYEFTTSAPIPGEDTPEYRQFIGQWEVSYTDMFGNPLIAMTVTVTEDVVGKTYKVCGMMDPFTSAQYSINDEVTAFFENGNIVFHTATSVLDGGALAESYDVCMFMIDLIDGGKYLDHDGYMYGEKSGDNIVFSGSSPYYIGYMFYGIPTVEGYQAGSIGSGFSNVVWSPMASTSNVGNTESFVSNPPVNPNWR